MVEKIEIVGPGNFTYLRNQCSERELRTATFPEIVQLFHYSFLNPKEKLSQNFLQTLSKYSIIGNTVIYYTGKGIFVEDFPEFNKKIKSKSAKQLKKELTSYEIQNRVLVCNKNNLRFIPPSLKIKTGSQNPERLSKNLIVIALVGGVENANKLVFLAESYKLDSSDNLIINNSYAKQKYFPLVNIPSINLRENQNSPKNIVISISEDEMNKNFYSVGIAQNENLESILGFIPFKQL